MHETREQWLNAAVEALKPLFSEVGVELPQVRVSVGWPSKGGLASKGKTIGQCWKKSVAADGVSQIFISPLLGDECIAVLAHELIHAWDDCKSQHKGEFARIARAIGLEGKLTVTTPGDKLADKLKVLIEQLGEYPHSVLSAEEMGKQVKKQTTRMLKLVVKTCDCEYTVRTTQKQIDKGMPSCPHGEEMEVD